MGYTEKQESVIYSEQKKKAIKIAFKRTRCWTY